MMSPFPFGMPPYRRPCQPYVPYNSSVSNNSIDNHTYNINTSSKSNNTNSNNYVSTPNNEDGFFEVFGLKLHSDDLLIIGLLFFLYQEKVDDTYLYIALILLLLS